MNNDYLFKNYLSFTQSIRLSFKEFSAVRDHEDNQTFFTFFSELLKSISLCNILQSHSKVLVLDSRLPLISCLKSLSHYHRDFAFVYDSENRYITGFIDEFSILKFLKDHESYINLDCSEFLELVNPGIIHKVPDDVTAYEGFEYTRKNKLGRLFVWCERRKVPVGYVTPSCYLLYILRNLRGRTELMELPIKTVHVDKNLKRIPDQTTFNDALDILLSKDNITVVNGKEGVVGLLTRRKLTYYALDSIRKETPILYSTPLLNIITQMDSIYNNLEAIRVDPTLTIKNAIYNMLLNTDRAVFYTNASGEDIVVTVWDIVRFILIN